MAELQTKKAKEDTKEKSLLESYRSYSATDIAITPYVDPEVPNMGLEKYGQVFFEGTGMMQSLRAIEINGVTRYLTNLDEFATSVKSIKDDKERLAKIKQIRETVAQLEYEIFFNKVDVKDENFWEKVNLKPTNEDFWSQIQFVAGNQPFMLDPKDPRDLLKIIAAEGGGFDDVATSLEEAKACMKPPKFYLRKKRDVKVSEGKLKMTRDNAIYKLYKTRMEEPQNLFILAKNILPISNSYRKTDRIEILYGELSAYIEGTSIQSDKKKSAQIFLNWAEKDAEYLNIRAMVLEGMFLKHIITKSDNKIYIKDTDSRIGSNIEECIEYLKDVSNQNDLNYLESIIDPIWNK